MAVKLEEECLINNEWSALDCQKPQLSKASISLQFHCLLVCFNPYKAFEVYILGQEQKEVTPRGTTMHTSSYKSP